MPNPVLPVPPRLSVVIPVHNESGNIVPLLDALVSTLRVYPPLGDAFEVVCVDDASTDSGNVEIRSAQRRYPMVRLIVHARRCGMSQALRNGIRAAKAPWIATMDGDGQNDPEDIPRLCGLAWERKDGYVRSLLVMGIRIRRADTVAKRLASRLANGVRRFVVRDRCPDAGCALKLFRRDDWLALPFFNGLHRFTPALFQAYGIESIFTPITDRPRHHGVSKSDFTGRALKGLVDMLGVLWLRARTPTPPERGVEVFLGHEDRG